MLYYSPQVSHLLKVDIFLARKIKISVHVACSLLSELLSTTSVVQIEQSVGCVCMSVCPENDLTA